MLEVAQHFYSASYLRAQDRPLCLAGCRMWGSAYGFDLEPEWIKFLQALSDAIVFYGTPEQYPPYQWSKTGNVCSLLS